MVLMFACILSISATISVACVFISEITCACSLSVFVIEVIEASIVETVSVMLAILFSFAHIRASAVSSSL